MFVHFIVNCFILAANRWKWDSVRDLPSKVSYTELKWRASSYEIQTCICSKVVQLCFGLWQLWLFKFSFLEHYISLTSSFHFLHSSTVECTGYMFVFPLAFSHPRKAWWPAWHLSMNHKQSKKKPQKFIRSVCQAQLDVKLRKIHMCIIRAKSDEGHVNQHFFLLTTAF